MHSLPRYRFGLVFLVVCLLSACSSSHHSSEPTPLAHQLPTTTAPHNVAAAPCLSAVSGGAVQRPPGMYGTLRMVGGPAPGIDRQVAGTITIQSSSLVCRVAINAGYSFNVMVPPGRYDVTGRSPAFGFGKYDCTAGGPINVTNAGPVDVEIVCPVR
jgi:hypothetical protein